MLGPDAFSQQSRLPARRLTSGGIDRLMIEVERGQQVAGHFPSASALDRARKVATGELTLDEAFEEIEARFH